MEISNRIYSIEKQKIKNVSVGEGQRILVANQEGSGRELGSLAASSPLSVSKSSYVLDIKLLTAKVPISKTSISKDTARSKPASQSTPIPEIPLLKSPG